MNVVDLRECSDARLLAGVEQVSCVPLTPFSEEACQFLDAVSRVLMKDARAKRYPDVVSFAFWCRKANIAHEKALRDQGLKNRIGRGCALHIAPGNVPVNFAFSYVFALLAGNASIVRCPSKAFDQVEIILDAMRSCFKEHAEIGGRSAFVAYPSAGSTTAYLSERADVRVIWGGDATVASVKALKAKPRCIDIAFADRYSIALINAKAVLEAQEDSLAKLARAFYNDTYLMDQNACSSPQTILWVGDDAIVDRAHAAFWGAVENEAKSCYDLQAAVSVDKHVRLLGDVMRGRVKHFEEHDGYLTIAWLDGNCELSTDLRGVGGFFYEKRVACLADIASSVNEKYQTLVQYGFDAQALRNDVLDLSLIGIDRIVPIGDAMDIGLLWDGFDLIDAMSRIVVAR